MTTAIVLQSIIRRSGLTPSAGGWSDETAAFEFSIETCGPATYNASKMVIELDKSVHRLSFGRHSVILPDLSRISQMTPFALAGNLRQPFENKGFGAFHANVGNVG